MNCNPGLPSWFLEFGRFLVLVTVFSWMIFADGQKLRPGWCDGCGAKIKSGEAEVSLSVFWCFFVTPTEKVS